MKQRQTQSTARRLGVLCLSALLPLATAQSATDLAQVPLYTVTPVPPNIFFLNDDSNSMDGETLIADTAHEGRLATEDSRPSNDPYYSNVDGIDRLKNTVVPPVNKCTFTYTLVSPHIDGVPDNYYVPDSYAFILDTDNTPHQDKTTGVNTCLQTATIDDVAAEEEWRVRFYETNPLYYDPKTKYLPWPGNNPNNNDTPFVDMDIRNAWIEPAVSDNNKKTIDLTKDSAVLNNGQRNYYDTETWKTWCHNFNSPTEEKCKRGGWRYYYRDTNRDSPSYNKIKLQWVKDLSDADKTNFANWFTYHRSRKNTAKYAIGTAVVKASDDGKRLGYGAINDIVKGTTNDIAYIPQHPLTAADHNRDAVLNKLYNTFGNGNTPSQKALNWVGKYYEIGESGDDGKSPILNSNNGGTCQLNNTVFMTDGFYTNADEFSGTLGNIDRDSGAPYADDYDDTLADIAMHYYERDLATSLDNKVPTGIHGVFMHQHMNTYTIAFGLEGTITNTNTVNLNTISWPDPDTASEPTDNHAQRIDDLFHAAVDGRGKYFSARNPGALVDALNKIVSTTPDTTDSANIIATSAFRLDTSQKAFSTGFDSTHWSGTVKALNINADGTLIETPAAWSSDDTLPFDATRTIITYSGSGGIPFLWDNLTSTQKISLRGASETDDTYATPRLNYLRGKTVTDPNTNDNITFRQRTTPLGDIANSSTTYGGMPVMLYPDSGDFGADGNRYSNFWNANRSRTPMVYVGANDGMLHGFRVSDGTELLAYVPNAIFSRLKDLTDPTFDSSHEYFVDQTPTVSDAYFNNNWHTVLVSGLGAGGQGLFALDITNPSNFSETNASSIALWEFTNANDSDLGYTLAKPAIVMTEGGQWVVISGNGYDSDSGRAALFILELKPDLTHGWTNHYTKIMAGDQTGNALFSPATVDSDGDGKVDHVYAGDRKGNLWVFDLSDRSSSNWSVRKLFTAKDGTTDTAMAQPITTKPTVIRHPTQPTNDTNKPNMLVLFGTGRYLSQGDLNTSDQQSFYAVWDDGHSNLTRADLAQQTFVGEGTDNTLHIKARLTDATLNVNYSATDSTKKYGWYLDLYNPDSVSTDVPAPPSERLVTNVVVYQGIALFTTYIPSDDPCQSGGKSWFMFLKDSNGGPPDQPVISINHDRLVNNNDVVTLANTTITNKTPSGLEIEGAFGLRLTQDSIIINTTKSGDATNNFASNFGATSNLGKRISWRELRRE